MVFRVISNVAQLLPFTTLRRSMGKRLIAPFYHAVSDEPMPHIQHLYRVKTVREFENDLDFLLRHYRPIDFHELSEQADKRNSKPPMLLSFDDGLREFYDIIAPVLLRKGIPAICFVNSGFLDNQDLFYRYKASLLINHGGFEAADLLAVRYADRGRLDEMAVSAGFSFDNFLQKQQPYLTTPQVESLLQQGFHFGAHSVDHPEYRFLTLEEQLRQTTRSVEMISNKFGLGYRLFSFPFTDYGVSRKFFDFVLEEKKVADYTFGCAGLKTDVHPKHIQRIPLEGNDLTAEDTLRREFFYFWLKLPFGKNRIRRT